MAHLQNIAAVLLLVLLLSVVLGAIAGGASALMERYLERQALRRRELMAIVKGRQ